MSLVIKGNEKYALVDAHFLLGPLLVTHFIVTSRKGGDNGGLGERECVRVFIDEARACLLIVGGKEASEEGGTVHCLVPSAAPVHLATQS